MRRCVVLSNRQNQHTEQNYPIVEIFDSIQGEGVFLGKMVTFVRFAGCNLACPWCDTKESWKQEEAQIMTVPEILEQCKQDIVVLTGGEPCLYNLEPLIAKLHEAKKCVAIETNGTLPTPRNADWVTCSPKPNDYYIHPKCAFNELKYVVDDYFDVEAIPKEILDEFEGCIWLQPEGFALESSKNKAYELVSKYTRLRLGVQLHKLYNLK